MFFGNILKIDDRQTNLEIGNFPDRFSNLDRTSVFITTQEAEDKSNFLDKRTKS
jgi:hypothetical protein